MRCSLLLLIAGVPLVLALAEKPAERPIDFAKEVAPLLVQHCLACHNGDKQKGGLRLDSRTATFQGGNSGTVVKPGDAKGSRLYQVVAGLDPDVAMPPGDKRLSAEQVSILRSWIDQGAKWPDGATLTTGPATSKHWSFHPIARPALPSVRDRSQVRNGVDAFVQARLERENLAPNPEADPLTLLRRLSLDLTGLPPTPAEIAAFQRDGYDATVEKLLASPAYGERWARHWLDLARYADSDGYEKDTGRPWAYRYRDWVIAALNADLPFDRFTIEQLAGDLLPGATVSQKIATGFHRNTLTNKEGGVDPEQFRVEAVIDRVSTTGRVWLGLTVGCTQCHDHKYDPLTQREFYQFFAFFNSDVEVSLPAPLADDATYPQKKAAHAAKLAVLEKAAAERLTAWQASLTEAQRKTLPAERKALVAAATKQDKEYAAKAKAIADHAKAVPQVAQAQSLALGAHRKTHVHLKGDFLRKGVEVSAGTPAVLPALGAKSASRLDLANWLVDERNPLTRRVIVNWVWSKFFGRGLVATLDDFGTQGEKPSHPDLLDWLATEFSAQGWSLKQLHRTIVHSGAYRRASMVRPDLREKDAYNVLLARQVRLRLEAETLRDVNLAVSGLLAPRVGGPSVRPPQPAGISELTYAGAAKWVESVGADRYRRGLYIWFQRTSPYPLLSTFDAPDGTVCTVRRERSNTPLQALTLLNDPVFVECAQHLARRIVAHSQSDEQRLRFGVRCALGREASSQEVDRLRTLLGEFRTLTQGRSADAAKLVGANPPKSVAVVELAAWVGVARTLTNLDEFVTRE